MKVVDMKINFSYIIFCDCIIFFFLFITIKNDVIFIFFENY